MRTNHLRTGLALLALGILCTLSGCASSKATGPSGPPTPLPSDGTPSQVTAVVHPLSGGPSGPITASAFSDRNHGWLALGTSVLATRDAGLTWRPVAGTDSAVHALSFPTATDGFAATDSQLLATHDGGNTWGAVQAQAYAHLSFADPNHGWAFGNNLFWRTQDGGKNWQQLQSPCGGESFGPFTFVSATTGWVMCAGQPATQQQAKQLFATSDGGTTWQRIAWTPSAAGDGALPMAGYVGDLFFRDANNGWFAEQRGGLYATTNGGRSWAQVAIPGRVSSFPHYGAEGFWNWPRPISAQDAYVVSTAGGQTALIATHDGGANWSQDYPSIHAMPMAFGTATTSYAVGTVPDSNALLRSVDGGNTWQQVGTIPADSTMALSFADATHGWAIIQFSDQSGTPRRALAVTTDGGVTWHKLQTAPADNKEQYATVSFVDTQTGFVATGWGHLYVTHDGGQSLQPVDITDSTSSNVQFTDPFVGWKIQDFRLMSTRDGGKTWTQISFPYRAVAFRFVARSTGHAWLIGQECSQGAQCQNMLFSTPDDGQHWTRYDLGSVRPASVIFADAQKGWLQDDQGHIYATTDGGHTWDQVL